MAQPRWIGEGTISSANVAMVSQTHDLEDFDKAPPTAGIRIGRRCWIGFGAAILPGVTIGDHTIVGSSSVVRTTFPNGHVDFAGAPAVVIGRCGRTGTMPDSSPKFSCHPKRLCASGTWTAHWMVVWWLLGVPVERDNIIQWHRAHS